MNNQNKIAIKRSNTLMNISGNLSVNATKIWLLGLSSIKWMDDDKIEINDKGQVITTLSKDFLIKCIPDVMKQQTYIRQIKKCCDELMHNTVGTITSDKDGFEIIGAYATKAKYKNDQLKITHNIDVIDLVDTKNKFCEYFYQKIASLNNKNYIKTYDLCIARMDLGKRVESIEFLRGLYNLKPAQLKQTGDFIKNIIKPSIAELNQNENIDIQVEYQMKKTGRKITHIKFFMTYKNQHPLELIKMQHNDLRSNLIDLGVSNVKIKTLAKYKPSDLLEAFQSTAKAKVKAKQGNKKFAVEGYFVKTLININEKSNTEDRPKSVQTFLDLIGIKNRNCLLEEFNETLTIEQKDSYFNTKQLTKSADEAIKNEYTNKFHKWIYYAKLNLNKTTI